MGDIKIGGDVCDELCCVVVWRGGVGSPGTKGEHPALYELLRVCNSQMIN